MFRSVFTSRGHTFELAPAGPGLRPGLPGQQVPPGAATDPIVAALDSPIDRQTLRRVAARLDPGELAPDDDALVRRLLAALAAGQLQLRHLAGPPRYNGAPGPAPEPPQEPERPDRPAPETNDWIEILLVDDQDRGIPNQRYLIVTPDGIERRGFTDSLGTARISRIITGSCKISFPDIDRDVCGCDA